MVYVIIPVMTGLRSTFVLLILLCAIAAQTATAQTESTLMEQLRSDYSALNAARSDFEQAEKSANTSPAEQADFAEWILQLSRQVAQSCRLLQYSPEHLVPADIPCDEYTSSYQSPVVIDINWETTAAEKTAAVVDRFNASLGDFDEKLLREQDRVKARKAQAASAGGGGGANGTGEGESAADGSEGAQAEDGTENGDGETGESGQQSGQQGDETGTSNNNSSNASSGRPSGGKPSSAPPGTPDGRNDDVIARQLREAAEQETDPELKRKLWAEYRRYKQGSP
ncbi:MAG: hypothetical protein L3J22_05355 [Xanthomonadales bacterium]|nr:hypothetical protein [Xanthomonadales bacterium]